MSAGELTTPSSSQKSSPRTVSTCSTSTPAGPPRAEVQARPALAQQLKLMQVPFSAAVRKAHEDKVLVGAVSTINTGTLAKGVLDEGAADVVFVGRQF